MSRARCRANVVGEGIGEIRRCQRRVDQKSPSAQYCFQHRNYAGGVRVTTPQQIIGFDSREIAAIEQILHSTEPRPLPSETMDHHVEIHGNIVATHHGWKCPICGSYCRRDDKTRYRRGRREEIIDYSGYNIHFAHNHATPSWRAQEIIKALDRIRS